MVSLLRRYRQPLMIAVTIMIIITFSYFGSRSDFSDGSGSGKVATIYGRPVTYAQTQKIARKFGLARELGMQDLAISLAGFQQDQESFIWNTLVLRHEAEELGVEPTDDEVLKTVQGMPAFQTNGHYDSARYTMITTILLGSRGM